MKNSIRQSVGDLFGYPMLNMTFLQYLTFMNSEKGIQPRNLLEINMLALSRIEELETKLAEHEANFTEIEEFMMGLKKEKEFVPEKFGVGEFLKEVEKANLEKPEVAEDLSVTTKDIAGKISDFQKENKDTFICDNEDCDYIAKTKAGLSAHKRFTHKPKETV